MSDIRTLDAGELLCPQPRTLTHEELHKLARETGQARLSSSTVLENGSHLFRNSCWGVIIEKLSEGNYWMMLKK
jgi:hypothetical protein